MASMRGHRVQVGSSSWIGEERSSALQIVQSEVEEFSYSARNELEWLNEHMAGIFDENEVNFAEAFKTPGKLRGKTPKSTRKAPLGDRAPLSDIFASTPNGSAQLNRIRSPKPQDRALKSGPGLNLKPAAQQPTKASQSTQDSGYYGSQDVGTTTPYAGQDYLESQTPLGEPENKSPAKSVYSSSPVKAQQSAAPKQEAEEHEFSSSPRGSDPGSESPQPPQNAELTQNAALESMKSPSDGSSPIRPMVRKSSINFASLPAREPLATGKSMGGRTSYLDANRTGYFRTPGGKSLGNLAHDDSDEEDEDKMAVDDVPAKESTKAEEASTSHAKTYTQRLQDQINKLGKSQTASIAQSKSVPNTQAAKASSIPKSNTAQGTISTTPKRKESIQQTMQTTPGAFPEDDDDDDWIEPSSAVSEKESRPMFPKSYSADVMEGIHNKQTVGQPEFALDKSRTGSSLEQESPTKEIASSTPAMMTKSISMTGGPMVNSGLQAPESPSRLFRDSPLRQVKNKLSSILKSSKGLLASSAAISAEGKSLMSPSLTRLGLYGTASSESVAESSRAPASPTRSIPRPVTASSEFDKEEKRRAKEEKLMNEQLSRLDKAREQEREKARVFSKEQERIAAMESQVASKKQAEAKKALPLPKAVRSSPRKGKSDDEDEHATEDKDTEMEDAPATAAQSLVPKPTATGHALRNREVKRPVKPGKDPLPKAKQVPTVIRVNTSSQNSQYHSSSRQSTNPQQDNTLSSSQQLHQLTNKASKPSLQTKASTQSLKPAPSGKSKAAEAAAAKKKEQEEREAQRRRNAKAEADRKRVALAEEQRRQEQQRRVEAEKKQKERDQAEEKKSAQRQAAIERAKQTKAPPPAARSQPNGPPDFAINQGKGIRAEQQQPPRPQSRMGTAAGPSSTVKAGTKRAVPGEAGDDGRPVSRAGYAYQSKDAKRRRTSEILSEEPEPASQHIKGPPVRPSAAFKKDGPSKTLFQNGYSTAPQGAARDLFKATVAPQHGGHAKGAHPLDMAQISNGKIPFAGNPNPPSSAYKTPARPGPFLAKSAAKSVSRPSPQFQNGESIELPEIQTDDEDEEDDAQGMPFAQWVESPFLRDQLARQDGMDPSQIFGPPVPINMEEVFQKSKERWHTFRARTSSANWSGTDRLTEDDIRRDMVAREKLRRDGGWSYEMSKGL